MIQLLILNAILMVGLLWSACSGSPAMFMAYSALLVPLIVGGLIYPIVSAMGAEARHSHR